MEPEYVESASGVTGRFTDAETMEAFTMAMAGKLNTELTALFREAGVDAVGLSRRRRAPLGAAQVGGPGG